MKNSHILCLALCFGVTRSKFSPFTRMPSVDRECHSAHGVHLGCFDNAEPFDDVPLPWRPDLIDPRFYLFTKKSDANVVDQLDLNITPSEFNPKLKTKIIIHGYLSSWRAGWVYRMKDELLIEGNYNVMLVEWSRGSQIPLFMYENAASNTRLIGAYLAKVLDSLTDQFSYNMSNVHCIGHSLGAQICGFAGKQVNSLIGRISGLDPAGPNFKDKVKEARLDVSDADFVDIIHTNGRDSFTIEFGIGQQLGDVDFVPNGGGIQPGCLNRRKKFFSWFRSKPHHIFDLGVAKTYSGVSKVAGGIQTGVTRLAGGIASQPTCSHSRAHRYFTESINSDCLFTAVPCDNIHAQSHGDCESCEGDECQVMGYHADTRPGRGIFYLETNKRSPYCIN